MANILKLKKESDKLISNIASSNNTVLNNVNHEKLITDL